MADHLQLPQPIRLDSRRTRPGFGSRPDRVPGSHGKKLRGDLDRAITAMRPVRIVEGVDPSYVFKICAVGRLEDSALRSSGLQWLGDTNEWTYFVLAPGDDPESLRANLDSYSAAGDRAQQAPRRAFFDTIEEFLPYGRDDRRGPGLPADGQGLDEPLLVDVVVWPSPRQSSCPSPCRGCPTSHRAERRRGRADGRRARSLHGHARPCRSSGA